MKIKKLSEYSFENTRLLEVVTKQLRAGKRYFGSSGGSLTHQVSNPKYRDLGFDKKIASIGLDGERKTTKLLKKWASDKPDVILIDSIHLDGMGKEEIDEEGVMEAGDTDHIVVFGSHIVCIDSKAWRKSNYRVNEKGEVLRNKKPFPGGKVRMRQAIGLWKSYLKDYDISISSIIVITQDDVTVIRDKTWWMQCFQLTNYNDFYNWLDRVYTKKGNQDVIYSDLIANIVKCCVRPYDAQRELLGNIYHLKNKGK